MLQKVF